MIKKDLWCGYCGTQDFTEQPDSEHPKDNRYSMWECTKCHAIFELNEGYGYFTSYWGDNSSSGTASRYSLSPGKLLDDTKLPRTPEGIMRNSGSREKLEAYLARTQVK